MVEMTAKEESSGGADAQVAVLERAIRELADRVAAVERDGSTEVLCVDAPGAARLLGVSRSFWLKLSSSGRCPAPVRLGERTLWVVGELREWVAAGAPTREAWQQIRAERKK